jgi:hypothetical protein
LLIYVRIKCSINKIGLGTNSYNYGGYIMKALSLITAALFIAGVASAQEGAGAPPAAPTDTAAPAAPAPAPAPKKAKHEKKKKAPKTTTETH